jgi:hypothetical protein
MKTLTSPFFTLFVVVFFLAACGTSETPVDTESEHSSEDLVYKGQEEIDAKIADRDDYAKWNPLNSLIYTHSDGSTRDASAFLNDKEEILKLIFRFADTKTEVYGERVFYVENGKKFATRETFYDNTLKNPVFIERFTVYDKNEKPIYSKERSAEYEIDLEKAMFKMISPKDCSIAEALQVLREEGPFETTFQGFASNGEMEFVIVGENKEIGYTSSIAVQHREGDIMKLMQNERKYVGVPLKVLFERIVDERGFEFQALLGLKINQK